MHLRKSELMLVAAGLAECDWSAEGDGLTLVRALESMPARDRAATWEVAVRRFGRHKPVAQAAGDIGLDEIRARELLERFTRALAAVPPPEHSGVDPAAELEQSSVARLVSQEMLANAIAHGELVDLDAEHEAALAAARAAEAERRASQ